MENSLDDKLFSQTGQFRISKRTTLKLLGVTILFIVLNIALCLGFENQVPVHVNGSIVSRAQLVQGYLYLMLLGVPILGLVLGVFLAFIPYKGLAYSQKFFTACVLSILGCHVLWFILNILAMLYLDIKGH